MQVAIWIRPIKFLFTNLVFDVIRFPVWWYTRGLRMVAESVARSLEDLIQELSLRILVRNLFTPMYGDYTKSGRAISFVVRLTQIGVYFFVTFLWTVLLGIGLFLWILLPAIVVYNIYYQMMAPPDHLLELLWNNLRT